MKGIRNITARLPSLAEVHLSVKSVKILNSILFITFLALVHQGQAQDFVNLDFELASTSGYLPNSAIPVTSAFPGWNVSYSALGVGKNIATIVSYDSLNLGGAFVSVNDERTGFGFVPIQGKYSAYLFGRPSDIFSPSNPLTRQ